MTEAWAALASTARRLGRAVHGIFFDEWGFRAGWFFPIALVVVVLLAWFLVVSVNASVHRASQAFCDDVSAMTGRVTVLSESGCYVEFGDRFVPYEKWLYLEEKGTNK